MARFFYSVEDFETYTIDTAAPGLTTRISTPTAVPKYGNVDYKRRYLAISGPAAATPVKSFAGVDALTSHTDSEVLLVFKVSDMTAEQGLVYFRGQANTDWIRVDITKAGFVSVDKMSSSTPTYSISSTAVTFDNAYSYAVRMRLIGSTMQIKVWNYTLLGRDGEPTAWNVTTTGITGVPSAGYTGIGSYHATVADQVFPVNFASFSTSNPGTVSAPCPISNTEYRKWLAKQDAIRVVLAKMNFTGYDSSASPYTFTKKAYVSNFGYNSKEYDNPPSQHYPNYISTVPTFSREMPTALNGQGGLNFGEMRLRNPVGTLPPTAEALQFTHTFTGAAPNKYVYYSISQPSYVIPSGARLKYDFWIDPANPVVNSAIGGIEVDLLAAPTSGRAANMVDTLGDVCVNLNSSGAHYVAGVWYSRDLPFVASMIGGTITNVDLVNEADTNGTYRALYRNIRITNAAGETLKVIWAGGAPTYSAVGYAVNLGTYSVTVAPASPSASTPGTVPTTGLLDDWVRIRWEREGFEMLLGDQSWPLHDFRPVVRGRLSNPTAPTKDSLSFKIADITEGLSKNLTDSRYTSGARNNEYKPLLIGSVEGHIEAPQTDASTLTYQFHDGAVYDTGTVYDNLVSLDGLSGRTITAVNTGTGELTTSADHGMVAGYILYFSTGTPPLSLSLGVKYYVTDVSGGTNKLKLSLTRGGAAITGGGSSTGSGYNSYGYEIDAAAGTFRLAASPQGRITIKNARKTNTYADLTSAGGYEDLFFTKLGLSLNYKDPTSFAALKSLDSGDGYSCGYWFNTEQQSGLEAVQKWANGTLTWFCPRPDGVIQVGAVTLPSGTPVYTFQTSEISLDGVRLVDVIRPVDYSKAQVSYEPSYFDGGPITEGPSVGYLAKVILTPHNYGSVAIPLDNFPAEADADNVEIVDTIYNESSPTLYSARLYNLKLRKLGVYEFDATLECFNDVNIGDVIALNYPRLGWTTYNSTYPASPDNTGTIDATIARVMSISVNLNAGTPFKVRIKCFRPISGLFPTANLT